MSDLSGNHYKTCHPEAPCDSCGCSLEDCVCGKHECDRVDCGCVLSLCYDPVEAKRRREAISEGMAEEGSRFCPVSLADWIRVCESAGVPYVPATKVAEMLKEDYLRFDTEGEHVGRLVEVIRKVEEAVAESDGPVMARMDFCSSLTIKYRLGSGSPEHRAEFALLKLDDPRAFDIMSEYPREAIPVFIRPWVDALVVDDYPVEYRAFVRGGALIGISSYYPQRPLRHSKKELGAVREMTLRLLEAVEAPFEWHRPMFGDGGLDLSGVHFTTDFMVTADGSAVFLEGGPPHEMGAHPCCFAAGKIDGVALSAPEK